MGKLTVGSIVLVKFPFSNLSGQKVRPAVVLAKVEFENIILCQITSKKYSSKTSIKIAPKDFQKGNLPVVSFVRPDKLFTADKNLIEKEIGRLNIKTTQTILDKVRGLFIS